jgi:hypothetical protein
VRKERQLRRREKGKEKKRTLLAVRLTVAGARAALEARVVLSSDTNEVSLLDVRDLGADLDGDTW